MRQEEISKKSDITIEKVLLELSKIAFSNITDFINVKKDSITLTDWSSLGRDQTACIESISQTKEGYRLKLYNKPQALELIGKYFNMFSDYKPPDLLPEIPEFENMSDEELKDYISRENIS